MPPNFFQEELRPVLKNLLHVVLNTCTAPVRRWFTAVRSAYHTTDCIDVTEIVGDVVGVADPMKISFTRMETFDFYF
jgi:hypothetical protein